MSSCSNEAFGLVSMVHTALRVAAIVEHLVVCGPDEPLSLQVRHQVVLELVGDVLQIVFQFLQSYFLFKYSKVRAHLCCTVLYCTVKL